MRLLKIFLLFLFIIPLNSVSASTISGIITNSDSTALSFSTIYVKNSTYGVTADYNGKYFIELNPGTYTIIYGYLGYFPLEKEIIVGRNENLIVDVVLQKSDIQITEIEVVANKVNKAKKIMKQVRNYRRTYLTSVNNFQCSSYVKTSIENEFEEEITDSLINNQDFQTYLKKKSMNLIEYVATTYYKRPNKFKENILAFHDFTEEKPINYQASIIIGEDYGQHDIAPNQYMLEKPFVFYNNVTSADLNFYKNQLDLPNLCTQPLVSPIASNSAIYYTYEFATSFYEDDVKINKIKVEPRNNVSALFYGNIYIEDSTWALVSVDLFINEKALLTYKNFNVIQNYQKFDDSIYLPVRTEIIYTINNGKNNVILGNTKIVRNDYIINQNIDRKIFNNEIISYQVDAMDKDSLYWDNNRPIALRTTELNFIDKTDSIKNYYLSDEYLDKQDSTFNHISWWSAFVGVGRKNHYTGNQIWVGGLLEQINPFGVGGYRHKLPIDFRKTFSNDIMVQTKFFIDYGFNNKDVKGKFGFGITYFPKKFVRTFIEVGDYYDMVNNYASFEQIFSRSNYVRNKTFEIKQRMEIFNGLYAELSYLYSNQLPINNLQLSSWSDFIFEDLNTPMDFEQYTKSEIRLDLKYVPAQKYIIKGNRKIIIGSDLPEISFSYRKGIPGLFNSEVNFDYIELGSSGIFDLARMGESRWQVVTGKFFNTENLRLLEYKFFRGSDQIYFSNPVTSMQLLPAVFTTNSEFLQANYIHHFNGSILNKVPLFKYLKLSIAAGGSSLLIPSEDFYQAELYSGLEKVFRIKTQLFRFGLYAVTADNNISTANFNVKFGISVYNSYTKKWDY